MKLYLLSLGAGILVGAIYALLAVKSPAPPVIALLGLLGMLIGEQAVPIARRLFAGKPVTAAYISAQSAPSLTGIHRKKPPADDPEAA